MRASVVVVLRLRCLEACRLFRIRDKTVSPALAGGFLTNEP